jgi:hypothetical protein
MYVIRTQTTIQDIFRHLPQHTNVPFNTHWNNLTGIDMDGDGVVKN